MRFKCEYCRQVFRAPSAQGLRRGCSRVFCSRSCSGKARRVYKAQAQRKAEKAQYDKAYREKNIARIKAKKRAYHLRTYDPERARRQRRGHMRRHVEYCRRYYSDPRRKAQKVAYDLDRRARAFGEFAPAYKLLLLLKREVRAKCPSKYERLRQRGYYDRANEKRKEKRHEAQAGQQ